MNGNEVGEPTEGVARLACFELWGWLEETTSYARDVVGLPLGLISGTTYAQAAVEFCPGDMLLLYTDGITESRDESGKELGHDGLLALVRDLTISPRQGPVAFGHALIARLRKYRGIAPRRDDETLVLIQRQTGIELDNLSETRHG